MSTQNWITQTALAGGLRMILGHFAGLAVDGNSQFQVNVGNCERIVTIIRIGNDEGYPVDPCECSFVRNRLTITVRGHPHPIGADGYPHSLLPQYTDLSDVTFCALLIVH